MEKIGVGLRIENQPPAHPTFPHYLCCALKGGALRYGGKEICSARLKTKMILLEKLDDLPSNRCFVIFAPCSRCSNIRAER